MSSVPQSIDGKLIAIASQCIALYQGLDQQLERVIGLSARMEAALSPEAQDYEAKIEKLATVVPSIQARTVQGLIAKAKLLIILDDGTSIDCGTLARSICVDIVRLEQTQSLRVRPMPVFGVAETGLVPRVEGSHQIAEHRDIG